MLMSCGLSCFRLGDVGTEEFTHAQEVEPQPCPWRLPFCSISTSDISRVSNRLMFPIRCVAGSENGMLWAGLAGCSRGDQVLDAKWTGAPRYTVSLSAPADQRHPRAVGGHRAGRSGWLIRRLEQRRGGWKGRFAGRQAMRRSRSSPTPATRSSSGRGRSAAPEAPRRAENCAGRDQRIWSQARDPTGARRC